MIHLYKFRAKMILRGIGGKKLITSVTIGKMFELQAEKNNPVITFYRMGLCL